MATICSQVPTLTQVLTVPTAVQITTTSEVISSVTIFTYTNIYATNCVQIPDDSPGEGLGITCSTYLASTSQIAVIQAITTPAIVTIFSDGFATVSDTLFGSSCSTSNRVTPPSPPGAIASPTIHISSTVPLTVSTASTSAPSPTSTPPTMSTPTPPTVPTPTPPTVSTSPVVSTFSTSSAPPTAPTPPTAAASPTSAFSTAAAPSIVSPSSTNPASSTSFAPPAFTPLPVSASSTGSTFSAGPGPSGTLASEKKIPPGAVIGGVAGGVILIVGLAWLVWHFFLKPHVPQNFSGGKQNAHNSYEKEDVHEPQNWSQNNTQSEQQAQPTKTEGQNGTGNTGTEQNQNQNHDFRHRRLPNRAEEKIKKKLDQYLNPPPEGNVGILTGLAGDAAAAGRPNYGYGQSPLLSPYANVPSHQRQPSYSGSFSGTSSSAPGWSLPSPPPGQYGAPVHGQIRYTQQASYNPQFVPGEYRGYGEPSGPTHPRQYGHP